MRQALELLTVLAGLALFGALPLALLAAGLELVDVDAYPIVGPFLGLALTLGALCGAYRAGHALHAWQVRRYWQIVRR